MLLSRYYHCYTLFKALDVSSSFFRCIIYATYYYIVYNFICAETILAFYLLWVTRWEAIEF